ncbi:MULTISPECIES: DUF732 domain-containing protein [unclassified Mycobacterium]|uniref:DUF732 domain-containing protein n=1 Tax=unclassified Mycobacterium TaxID=2642494 RepID=UPI0007FC92A3|nr:MULTISPECIES: DUF732 domain-containing protein [unclassified Mycobacterium]OBH17418.1 glycine cleavage system P protein [Mycobacterium sp. E3247]OBI12664.1 glycine cleavage system P protein [Mycobacterium sp. E2497]
MRLLVALIVGCAVIMLAAPAYGDPDTGGVDESSFLASLSSAGITYKTSDAAVQFAKAVCESMGNGEYGPQMVNELKAQNPGLTTDHATSFLAIAAKYYCPQQLNKS